MQAVLIPLLICSVVADFGLMLYSATRADRTRSLYTTLLSFFLVIYTMGYLTEILSQDAQTAFTALQIENFGIPFIAPMFLLTAICLFWRPMMKRWYLAAALIYGFTFALVVLFNPYHWLYYTSITMVSDGATNFAVLGHGPLYFAQQAVTMLCMLVAYSLVLVRFAKGSRKLRRQMVYLIAGAVIAMAANILNFSGILPAGLDPTPFCLAVGSAFFIITLYSSNLTDVVLIALDTAVETMNDAIIVLDETGAFLHGNHAARRLFPKMENYSATAPICKMEGWPEELGKLEGVDTIPFQISSDGPTAYYRADIHKMVNKHGKHIGWSIVIQDTTDITVLMKQLERLASTDYLTGILNRRKFYESAQSQLMEINRDRKTAALILFDIDWFKKVNDTYGHSAGDEVLRAVTKAVSETLGEGDLIGRLGGEEFVLFMSGKEEGQMREFAESLRNKIASLRIPHEGHMVSVTASVGVVMLPEYSTLETAMQDADRAMYEAKAKGRDCVVLYTAQEIKPL